MPKTIAITGKTRRLTRVKHGLTQSMSRAFRPVMLLSAAGAILAALLIAWLRPLGLDLELWTQDWRQAARFDEGESPLRRPGEVVPGTAASDPWEVFDVCIVTEDEASIRALDGVPITPTQEATLIDVLSRLGVQVIAFDTLYSERRAKIFPFGPGSDSIRSAWFESMALPGAEPRWLWVDGYRQRFSVWEGPTRESAARVFAGALIETAAPEAAQEDTAEGVTWYRLQPDDAAAPTDATVRLGEEFALGQPLSLPAIASQPATQWWPIGPTGLIGQIRRTQDHRDCRVLFGWKFEIADDAADPTGGTLALDEADVAGRAKIPYWPLPEITAVAGQGCLNFFVRDRVVRGYPYVHNLGDAGKEPSLALACALALAELRGESLDAAGLELLNSRLPSTGVDLRPLNFYGPPGTIPTVPWAELTQLWTEPLPVPAEADADSLAEALALIADEQGLTDLTLATLNRRRLFEMRLELAALRADPTSADMFAEGMEALATVLAAYEPALAAMDPWRERLQGKTALVGSWTLEVQDFYDIPIVSDPMYGVEIHATALQNLWDAFDDSLPLPTRVGLTEMSRAGEFLVVAILAGLMALLGMSLPYFWSAGAGILLGIAFVQFALAQFLGEAFFVPITYPLFGTALTWVVVSGARFFTLDRERRQIDSLFKNYVDRRFVEILKKDPSKISLGGDRREITIFFSDVAGFSGIAEQLEPEELVRLLNEYLGAMTDIILQWDGTIDKYIGDAVMAFWNAPLEIADHAVKGCYAALEQREQLQILQRDWQARGFPLVTARMGLNTGNTVHANVGSRLRKNYTLMGDPVNLAARFEPLNKDFNTGIIIGEDTWQLARDHVLARRLGRVQIKGRRQPVAFYELLGRKRDTTPGQAEMVERFDAALGWYDRADFARAVPAWEAILKRFPGDGPSRTYLALARRYLKTPPSADKPWDGVFVQTHK